jgi:hypothetical protein
VQVRGSVGQAGRKMEQSGGRLAGDSCVTIGCTGDDAFKEAKNTSQALHTIQSTDEVHL